MSRGKLKSEDEEIIQKNFRYLKNELESLDLLDYLFEKKVITNEDKIRIKDGKTRSERNEDLLQTILHSGPGPSFDFFLSSLEEKYSQVYKQLKTKDDGMPKTIENDGENASLKKEDKVQKCKCAQKDVKIDHLNKQLTEVTAERDEALEREMELQDDNKQLRRGLDEALEREMELQDDNKQLRRSLANRIDIMGKMMKAIVFLRETIEGYSLRRNEIRRKSQVDALDMMSGDDGDLMKL